MSYQVSNHEIYAWQIKECVKRLPSKKCRTSYEAPYRISICPLHFLPKRKIQGRIILKTSEKFLGVQNILTCPGMLWIWAIWGYIWILEVLFLNYEITIDWFFNIIVIIIIIIIFFSQGKDYNWLEHIGWLEEKMKWHGQNWIKPREFDQFPW